MITLEPLADLYLPFAVALSFGLWILFLSDLEKLKTKKEFVRHHALILVSGVLWPFTLITAIAFIVFLIINYFRSLE